MDDRGPVNQPLILFLRTTEPFVVLDDDYLDTLLSAIDEDLKHPLAARVVLCPLGVGLTIEHLPIILDALASTSRFPRIRKSEMTSRRAGALAEMCGAAKHKAVKLSVSAAVASMALRG